MILDSSAILAVLFDEPEAEILEEIIAGADKVGVSSVSLLEAGILMESRKGENGARELDYWLLKVDAEIIPFDREQADLARAAFKRFGKGRHPAGLNFGDCAVYALSKCSGEPLLFKGDDFARTDVEVVPLS